MLFDAFCVRAVDAASVVKDNKQNYTVVSYTSIGYAKETFDNFYYSNNLSLSGQYNNTVFKIGFNETGDYGNCLDSQDFTVLHPGHGHYFNIKVQGFMATCGGVGQKTCHGMFAPLTGATARYINCHVVGSVGINRNIVGYNAKLAFASAFVGHLKNGNLMFKYCSFVGSILGSHATGAFVARNLAGHISFMSCRANIESF